MSDRKPRPWHCYDCGVALPDTRLLSYCTPCWSSKNSKLPIPIRQMTPDQLRAYKRGWRKYNPVKAKAQERRYVAKHFPKCQDCGGRLTSRAKRCLKCWYQHLNDNASRRLTPEALAAHRLYMREYMARWRAGTVQERTEAKRLRKLKVLQRRSVESGPCLFNQCSSWGTDHRHCDCGLPIKTSEVACQMCVQEQKRTEFKTWEAA